VKVHRLYARRLPRDLICLDALFDDETRRPQRARGREAALRPPPAARDGRAPTAPSGCTAGTTHAARSMPPGGIVRTQSPIPAPGATARNCRLPPTTGANSLAAALESRRSGRSRCHLRTQGAH